MQVWLAGIVFALIAMSPVTSGDHTDKPVGSGPPVVRAPVNARVPARAGSTRNGVVFEVFNLDDSTATYKLACERSGAATSCSASPSDVEIAAGGKIYARVRYVAGTAGDGEVALVATGAGGTARAAYRVIVTDSGTTYPMGGEDGDAATMPVLWFYPWGGTFGSSNVPVSITWCPNGGTLKATSRRIYLESVDVTSSFSYDPTTDCAGGRVSNGTLTLASGDNLLEAEICNIGADCTYDSAIFNYSGGQAPVVSLAPHSGSRLDRSGCVISSAGPGAAFQCGELIATHAMPAYTSMNRERSLGLFYNSGTARIQPVIMADVSLPSGAGPPDSVRVVASVDGITKGTYRFAGAALYNYGPQRLAVSFLDNGLVTGVHALQLTVTNVYGGSSYSTTVSDDLIIVNRTASPYGAGWNVLGIEQLHAGERNGAVLRVDADGSAGVYEVIASNTWQAPAGAFRDTIRYDYISDPGFPNSGAWQAGYYYWRRDLDGTRTFYNQSGLQTWVHTRAGDVAQYTYGSQGELTSIRVAPHSAGLTYTFAYSSGKLDYVQDPSGRVLDATVSSGRLADLLDPGRPGTQKVLFAYTNNLLTSRRSAGGHYTTYAYVAGTSTLSQATLPTTQAGAGVIGFTPVQSRGLWQSHGQNTVNVANATVEINGPRTDVTDIATFWVNGQGAPMKVRGPTGDTTRIHRLDSAVPALPTQVVMHNGRSIKYTWNANGTLSKMRDSTWTLQELSPTAVTSYDYSSPYTKARPSRITDPVNQTSEVAYHADGQIAAVTAPNGHVTRFDYYVSPGPNGFPGQIMAVVEENVTVFDSAQAQEFLADPATSFTYDSIGNLRTQTSPRGGTTTFHRDAAGRVQHAYDPGTHHNEFVYDALNRMTESIHHAGPSVAYTTRQAFGAETLDTVFDPRNVQRRFTYDALGRQITETDEAGATENHTLNLAGLVTMTTTRRNNTIRHTYDAAGRKTKTAWSAADVPADSVIMQYDSVGQLVTATNSRYKTTRTYYRNGLVKQEVQSQANGAEPYTNRYWYDAAGRRVKYAIGSGLLADTVWYNYHSSTGVLKSIAVRWRSGVRDSVVFTFDALGRRDLLVYSPHRGSMAITVDYSHDLNGNLVRMCSDQVGAGQQFDAFRVGFAKKFMDLDDNAGRISTGAGVCGSGLILTTDYDYDTRHQVITESVPAGPTHEYEYDASGNKILDRFTSGASVTEHRFRIPTASNRMDRSWSDYVGYPSQYTNVTYHSDGSRNQEVYAPTQNISRGYFYDGLGRTAGLAHYNPDSHQWEPQVCLYGPMGELRRPCEEAAPALGHDGPNTVRTGQDAADEAWTFLHGPGTDDPLMGYHSDGVYIYFITDGSGRQYSVGSDYGADFSTDPLYSSVKGGRFAGGTTNAHSFGADRFQNSVVPGLSFFRNRFYDQNTGRWTQEDPLGVAAGTNLYAYVGNNPVTYTDPFGLNPCRGARSVAVAIGAAVSDGPVPIGDAVAIACVGVAVVSATVAAVSATAAYASSLGSKLKGRLKAWSLGALIGAGLHPDVDPSIPGARGDTHDPQTQEVPLPPPAGSDSTPQSRPNGYRTSSRP